VLGSNVLRAEGDRYALTGPLSEVSIPASLHESLMARLDRLPTVREVAQLGAVLGREFAYEMLRAIGVIDEPRLRDGLGRLVEAELLYQRGRPPHSRYIFKHALIQDAAYQSLLRRTRQHYHRQVAELLERNFADTVEASPELVGHHYSEAGPAGAGGHLLAARRRARGAALGQSGGDRPSYRRPGAIGAASRDAGAGKAGADITGAVRPGEHGRQGLRVA
jgi:predicted ATPase